MSAHCLRVSGCSPARRGCAHLHQLHGANAVDGEPAGVGRRRQALGRFEAGTLPKSFDRDVCLHDEDFERSAIDDILPTCWTAFPDRGWRPARSMIWLYTAFPATPRAAPSHLGGCPGGRPCGGRNCGGIGALTTSVKLLGWRRGPVTFQGDQIVVDNDQPDAGRACSRSWSPPGVTIGELIDPAVLPSEIRDRRRIDHRGNICRYVRAQPPPSPYQASTSSAAGIDGRFCTPEQVQRQWRRGIVGRSDRGASLHDPSGPGGAGRVGVRNVIGEIKYGVRPGKESKWDRT